MKSLSPIDWPLNVALLGCKLSPSSNAAVAIPEPLSGFIQCRPLGQEQANAADIDGLIASCHHPNCQGPTAPLSPQIKDSAYLPSSVLQDLYQRPQQAHFLLRLQAHCRARRQLLSPPSLKALIAFHGHYKYLLMAQDQTTYRTLGRLLGQPFEQSIEEQTATYLNAFMLALKQPANRGNHVNTLLHMAGYIKRNAAPRERQHLQQQIHDYQEGTIELPAVIRTLRHALLNHGSRYINDQYYLWAYTLFEDSGT